MGALKKRYQLHGRPFYPKGKWIAGWMGALEKRYELHGRPFYP
jgi:hypothetical protein